MVAEPLDVRGAQLGAVAVAEVVDLVVAQCLADHVHVARDGRGTDVGQESGAHPVDASLGQLPVELLDVRYTGRAVVDHRIAPVSVELGVGAAPQRRGRVADPSGVKAHQVEVAGDVGDPPGCCHPGDHVDGGRPGPPGLTNSDPTRWPVAGTRITASWLGLHRDCCSRPGPTPLCSGQWGCRWCRQEPFAGAPFDSSAATGCGAGVCPDPGAGRRRHRDNRLITGTSRPNESSAELNGLRRRMAVIVAPSGYSRGARKGHALISSAANSCARASVSTLRRSAAWCRRSDMPSRSRRCSCRPGRPPCAGSRRR